MRQMSSGNSPLTISETAVYVKLAGNGLSKAVLKCSYLHPGGPVPEPLGVPDCFKKWSLRAQMW